MPIRAAAFHTGAEYESGDVHRSRGINEPAPGIVPEPAGMHDPR